MKDFEKGYVSLNDISTKIGSGATPIGGKEAYHASGISLIRSLNVYNNEFSYDNLAFIDQNQAARLNNVIVEEDDILLNITGASVCRCCIVPRSILPARVNQHVSIIRINRAKADPRYVLYTINSPTFKQALFNISMTGATREALTKSDICNFKIPLPKLKTQQKIASILSAYDDLIENNKRRIAILEKMAEEIYREWFVRMRFPGRPQSKTSAILPIGWKYEPLDTVCLLIKRGISPSYNLASTNIVLNQRCIRDNKIDLQFAQGHDTRVPNEKYVKYADVLINSTGVGTLGRVSPVEFEHENLTVDSHVTICRADPEKINPHYLAQTVMNLQTYFEYIATGSTGQVELGRSIIGGTKILIPSDDLQKKFSDLIKPYWKQKQILNNQNINLTRTRDLLLPRLISGKLSVENIELPPNDRATLSKPGQSTHEESAHA